MEENWTPDQQSQLSSSWWATPLPALWVGLFEPSFLTLEPTPWEVEELPKLTYRILRNNIVTVLSHYALGWFVPQQ